MKKILKYFLLVSTLPLLLKEYGSIFVGCNKLSLSSYCNYSNDVCNVMDIDGLLEALDNLSVIEIEVRFGVDNYYLDSVLQFHNKLSVSLYGISSPTINCESNEGWTGLIFSNISNVTIRGVTISGCRSMFISFSENFTAGIVISDSHFILLENVILSFNIGRGIFVRPSNGSITIANSSFIENHGQYSGGGIFINARRMTKYEKERNVSNSAWQISVTIINSFFENNNAKYNGTSSESYKENSIGNGGGLNLILQTLQNSKIIIQSCKFTLNEASFWGGGINIALKRNVKNNSILIQGCEFDRNHAPTKGGGAVDLGYFETYSTIDNIVEIINTSFRHNNAQFGGGVHVSSSLTENWGLKSNKIFFRSCYWNNNSAKYASALYLNIIIETTFNRNGNVPMPTFEDCSFVNNAYTQEDAAKSIVRRNRGAFYAVGYKIVFQGNIYFKKNYNTALYLVSSTIEFVKGTCVKFEDNSGEYGGAVALYGSSTFHLTNNVHFYFFNNSAEVQGGALLQQTSSYLEYIARTNCFVHLINESDGDSSSNSFVFKNNHVTENGNKFESSHGKSVYLYSIQSCQKITNFTSTSRIDFSFENSLSEEISTEGKLYFEEEDVSEPPEVECIPGKKCQLPLKVLNDYKLEIDSLVRVLVNHDKSSSIKLHPSPTHLFDDMKVILLGAPGSNGFLKVALLNANIERELQISVNLLDCPPGYSYDSGNASCQCSQDQYYGILRCDDTTYQAILRQSFWIGYKVEESDASLYSSLCPRGYCNKNMTRNIKLPETANKNELDELICGPNRAGLVCGQCRQNYSTFFHSEHLNCHKNYLCNLGFLMYFISELLPITILFVFITLFNVQLTCGSIQGFILFAQLFDTLLVTAHGQILLHDKSHYMLLFLRMTYGMFNLEFFTTSKLSFCLWRGASPLDILAMKYVTMAYSFLLVVLLTFILNKCRLMKWMNKLGMETSMIHGLSGFLIMCYSQCTKVSLQILTPVQVYAKGQRGYETCSFYDGNLKFFKGVHLWYAIPAVIMTLTIVLLPPFIFISYPLCYRLFKVLHIAESSLVKVLCMIVPLEKFKPFFDSFQSCFKDEYRYFAGLYFLYRLTTLISFAAFSELSAFYIAIQIQFTIMFSLHSWAQPYKKQWQNKLETLVFATLIISNLLTIYNYNKFSLDEATTPSCWNVIHILVVYIPLLYFVVYVVYKVLIKFKRNLSLAVLNQRPSLDGSTNPKNILLSDFSQCREEIIHVSKYRNITNQFH